MRKKIAVLVGDGCIASMVSAINDIFYVATECIQKCHLDDDNYGYDVVIVSSDGREIGTIGGSGMLVDTYICCSVHYDFVIVVDSQSLTKIRMSNGSDYLKLTRWIKHCHMNGSVIFSIGEAIHLLAKSEILNNQMITVAPHNYEFFKDSFPKLNIVSDSVVNNKNIITVKYNHDYIKGLFSYLNYHGKERVVLTCNDKIKLLGLKAIDIEDVCNIPFFDHKDIEIKTAQKWFLVNFGEKVCIEDIPSKIGMGGRNFKRRFKIATGKTPTSYLQEIRILAAKRWLEDTDTPILKISEKVGYSDLSSFCRLFKKHTGQSMKLYRQELKKGGDIEVVRGQYEYRSELKLCSNLN